MRKLAKEVTSALKWFTVRVSVAYFLMSVFVLGGFPALLAAGVLIFGTAAGVIVTYCYEEKSE